jgi:hypothetical protein
MNLFWKRLFGSIISTAKLEKNEAELIEAMHRYAQVEKSLELAEYNRLFHVVKSSLFKENRDILKNRKYKDTEEFRTLNKYNIIANSRDTKLYYHVLQSEELKQFLVFESSPEYEQLGNKKLVKASEKLQKLKSFEKSKAYKNYVRLHNSFVIKEHESLKEKISTAEFKKSNEFWSNPKRWETTPEYLQERRFYELADNPDIIFYLNEKPERFDNYRSLELTFKDEFDGNTLQKNTWSFGFHYKTPELIGNHSFANEKQANNEGKNISVSEGALQLITKKETITTRAWHSTKGFIEKEFDFTSDVMHSANFFRQKHGIIRAKIRCTGKLHHAFWLGTDKMLPHISIFHYNGKYITFGNATKNVIDGIEVKGLMTSQYYIYSLEWTKKELIWKINNYEVYRTENKVPQEEMYLAFNSFISQKQSGTTGLFEVDWVRVYEKKS